MGRIFRASPRKLQTRENTIVPDTLLASRPTLEALHLAQTLFCEHTDSKLIIEMVSPSNNRTWMVPSSRISSCTISKNPWHFSYIWNVPCTEMYFISIQKYGLTIWIDENHIAMDRRRKDKGTGQELEWSLSFGLKSWAMAHMGCGRFMGYGRLDWIGHDAHTCIYKVCISLPFYSHFMFSTLEKSRQVLFVTLPQSAVIVQYNLCIMDYKATSSRSQHKLSNSIHGMWYWQACCNIHTTNRMVSGGFWNYVGLRSSAAERQNESRVFNFLIFPSQYNAWANIGTVIWYTRT